MKKYLFLLTVAFFFLMSSSIIGQSTFFPGFKYQAVLRDDKGQPMANQELDFKISITSADILKDNHFSESHHIITDQNGLFELIIGQGQQKTGTLADLPWADQQLWLQIEMPQAGLATYGLVSRSPLMAVPYAIHAANTSAILDPNYLEDAVEKSGTQSIYWTTSGNAGTNPLVHFLGSRDSSAVTFRANNKPFLTLTTNGKLQLTSEVLAGPDNNKSFYPVVVEGTLNTQGVWVKINGSRSKANNFVTFADDIGIQGRIEGQTITELENSDSYKTLVEVTGINTAALTSKIVEQGFKTAADAVAIVGAAIACIITLGAACPDVSAQTAGLTADVIKLGVWIVELATFATATAKTFERIRGSVGVSYSSGYGDYAEWLLRKPGEMDLHYGEIVAVSGGMVSRNTAYSNCNMVVSQYPAVIGKTPAEGMENQYEKIAFKGQVPVRIIGKVRVGDYIIPSGRNDGMGKAVHPNEMAIADYSKIVGVAWETIENDLPFKMVKIGVGIRANDLAKNVDDLEKKVENILKFLEGKGPLRPDDKSKDSTTPTNNNALNLPKPPSAADFSLLPGGEITNEEYNKFMDDNADQVKSIFLSIENKLKADGHDFSNTPGISQLLKDPVNTLKLMHSSPEEFTKMLLGH